MKPIRLNRWGNAYPEGAPIYKVRIIKDGQHWPKGTEIEVMESLNPYFKGMWRLNDSNFMKKDACEIIE